MAVLVEGISVVVRGEALLEKYPGGFEQFREDVPNQTLCADNELARVGFMSPIDVESYVRQLEARGLVYLRDGKAQDVLVVDQLHGPAAPCSWAEYGHVSLGGDDEKMVALCRLLGGVSGELVMPEGWTFENSLSARFTFTPEEEVAGRYEFLRRERGCDVFLDRETGREVFTGRTARSE